MPESDVVVLQGAAVVDVRTGDTQANSSVLVQGKRISRIGLRDEVIPPPGAEIVDVSGTWLIPGLIDMHVHAQIEPLHTRLLPLYLAHGVTTVRDVGGNISGLSFLRADLSEGRRTGPRLYFAGPLLDGIPPLWIPMTFLVDTEARARSAVRMLVDQNVDCIKVYNSVPETSLRIIVEEAEAAGLMVLGHVPRSLSTSRAIQIGMACLEHIRVTGRELLPVDEADKIDYLPLGERETLLWERFDVESAGMRRLIQLMVDAKTFLDPTLIVDIATSIGRPQDEAADEIEQMLPEAARATLRQDDWTGWLSGPAELQEKSRQGFEKRLTFISMCNDAGVKLLAGTDTFGPGSLLPGVSLHNELQLLAQAGLSPLQALQAATETAASALNAQGEFGVLEEGALADMLVLEANPLADVGNLRKQRLIVQEGKLLYPGRLVASAVEDAAAGG